MLKGILKLLSTFLLVSLILTSCTKNAEFWRKNNIMIQLYNQVNQETTLAYFEEDLKNVTTDKKIPSSVAYVDNYRKEIIFTEQDGLKYNIHNKTLDTSDEKNAIDGYVSSVLFNESYQIGIEILNVNVEDMEKNEFGGARTRIIDLNTRNNIIIEGLLYNRCLIQGDYLYGMVFDFNDKEYLEITNLKTMTTIRKDTDVNNISFLYESGNDVYAQSSDTKTSFLITGGEIIEDKKKFSEFLPNMENGTEIIKNVGVGTEKYIIPETKNGIISTAHVISTHEEGAFKKSEIIFSVANIIQVMDVTFLPLGKVAIFYVTKDENDNLKAIVSTFDENNVELDYIDVTDLRDDLGRFTSIDYLL